VKYGGEPVSLSENTLRIGQLCV